MEQFYRRRRSLFVCRGHHRIIDKLLSNHRPRGDDAVRQAFSARDYIRSDVKLDSREGFSHSAKPRDDFIEYQQDAMLRADLTQSFQVSDRRRKDACRAWYGLHYDSSDIWGVVQCNNPFQLQTRVRTERETDRLQKKQ